MFNAREMAGAEWVIAIARLLKSPQVELYDVFCIIQIKGSMVSNRLELCVGPFNYLNLFKTSNS